VIYRTPMFSGASSMADLVVRDKDGQHGRPNVQFQKWKMNSLGMRGPEVPAAVPPNTIRVITVGASETFGQRESPNREFPRQLEDSLAARVKGGACGGTKQFQVLNAAFAGMALPTIAQDIETRLTRLHPDVIVVYPTPAQYLNYDPPLPAPKASPDSSYELGPMGLLNFRVFTRFREQFKLVLPVRVANWLRERDIEATVAAFPKEWRFTWSPNGRLRQFDHDLRRVIGLVHTSGAVPVIATHANAFRGRTSIDKDMLTAWVRFYPRATGQVILQFDSLASVAVQHVGADSGVVTVDAARRMEQAPRSAFSDFVHFTDLGSATMASVLADGVLAATAATDKCGAKP
jgi:hypothetical protein